MARARDTQVGGGHYKDLLIQPVEYIHKNGIPFIEGCIIKYATRWRDKGGIDDLRKIKHFTDLLIEMELEGREEEWTDTQSTSTSQGMQGTFQQHLGEKAGLKPLYDTWSSLSKEEQLQKRKDENW